MQEYTVAVRYEAIENIHVTARDEHEAQRKACSQVMQDECAIEAVAVRCREAGQ